MKGIDLSGKDIGFWKVLHLTHTGKKRLWSCQCVCGAIRDIQASNLLSGSSKSCGCKRPRNITHGLSKKKSPEYLAWKNARSRCNNSNRKDYIDYGGRGITVCERWNDFEKFLEDMGKRPSSQHSLDRREVNGNYEPDNCRWATKQEQVLNRRKQRKDLTKKIRLLEQLSGKSIDDLIGEYGKHAVS